MDKMQLSRHDFAISCGVPCRRRFSFGTAAAQAKERFYRMRLHS